MTQRLAAIGVLVALAITLDGCVSPGHSAVIPATQNKYLGVYEQGTLSTYRAVSKFAAETGRVPNIVLYYSGWYEKFNVQFAERAYAHGAVPFVQIDPTDISLAAIAAGKYDTYLQRYAAQVRIWGHPVLIGFAHEMNGDWYSWGYTHVTPATWVAAWRHVVDVFRSHGADNVTWLWTPNGEQPGMPPLRAYWPGAAYVTWVGINGYLEVPSDSYDSVFGSTVTAIRTFTGKPILLSEIGVGPDTGRQSQDITAVFNGIHRQHLLGLVWFDVDQNDGINHQDWRLENSPAAIAAFRSGVRNYG